MRLTIEQQFAELKKPIDATCVKQRVQGGTKVSYVPGWHVIEELNRIFGHDRWTTVYTSLTHKGYERKREGKTSSVVAYTAQVELAVTFADGSTVKRCDVGAGTGISNSGDWGDAAEKAAKEAATDALKRAARTLGNTFGLSLYDKENAEAIAKGKEDSHGEESDAPRDPAPPKPGELTDAERIEKVCGEILKLATQIDPERLPARVTAWLDETCKGRTKAPTDDDMDYLIGTRARPGKLTAYGRELRENLEKQQKEAA